MVSGTAFYANINDDIRIPESLARRLRRGVDLLIPAQKDATRNLNPGTSKISIRWFQHHSLMSF